MVRALGHTEGHTNRTLTGKLMFSFSKVLFGFYSIAPRRPPGQDRESRDVCWHVWSFDCLVVCLAVWLLGAIRFGFMLLIFYSAWEDPSGEG